MNGKRQSTWFRILFSVALAFLSGLLAYVTLMALPAAATNQFPNWSNGWTPLEPLADTSVFTVTGTVNSQDGTPVENVQVYAFSGVEQVETFTNSSGQYTLTLSVGNFYDIVFNPPVGMGLASQFERGIHEAQTLNVTLPPGHAISGTVYSDTAQLHPVANVAIFAFNQDTFDGFGLPRTETDGTYQISLEAGTWDLTFTPPLSTTPPLSMGLGPTQTTVILTEDITLNIVLTSGFAVYGQVTVSGGGGQGNVDIFAQDPSQENGYGFAPTGPSGFYTGIVPSGTSDIQFLPPPFLGFGSDVITDVTGPPDVELNHELPPGHTVSGTVMLCGNGLANAFVHAAPHSTIPGDDIGGWGRFAGADGFYALALQPGVYTFSVDWPGDNWPDRIVPTVEVTQDLTLDFGSCTLFLPIISKNWLLIDDFDDGQDPNAIGGRIYWDGPCVITSPSDYDPIDAYGGSGYGYCLSYDVTPTCHATWQTELLGQDFSRFSTLTFQIKGALGNEHPHIYLQDMSSWRAYVDVDRHLPGGQVTTDWQQARIPLSIFDAEGVDLTALDYLQIVFEWMTMSGTICIDEIRFEL